MAKEQKSKISKFSTTLYLAFIIIAGGIIGFFTMKPINDAIDSSGFIGAFVAIVILFVVAVFAILFHIIIHEAGHLIFGKLSGYQFVSFRVGSIMFIKENGKLKVKRFNIVGTGGQCLMMPDSNWSAYEYPYVLYNLGGSLANLIVALVAIVLYLVLPETRYVPEALFLLSVIGFASALTNGIPMKIEGLANDGYNIISLNKDRQARRALYMQLHINGLQTKGTRLKDMPEGYFEISEDGDLTNPLIAAIGVFKCNYLHDKKEFTQGKEYSLYLIENAPGLLDVYKNELKCELLFYEIIGLCRQDEIDKLYTKELQEYIKKTSGYVSRRRLMYTYEMFVNNDKVGAKKQEIEFEKVAKNYPYVSDIEAERELIEFVNNLYKIKNLEPE